MWVSEVFFKWTLATSQNIRGSQSGNFSQNRGLENTPWKSFYALTGTFNLELNVPVKMHKSRKMLFCGYHFNNAVRLFGSFHHVGIKIFQRLQITLITKFWKKTFNRPSLSCPAPWYFWCLLFLIIISASLLTISWMNEWGTCWDKVLRSRNSKSYHICWDKNRLSRHSKYSLLTAQNCCTFQAKLTLNTGHTLTHFLIHNVVDRVFIFSWRQMTNVCARFAIWPLQLKKYREAATWAPSWTLSLCLHSHLFLK